MKRLAWVLLASSFALNASAVLVRPAEWVRYDSTGFEVHIYGYGFGGWSGISPNGRWSVSLGLMQEQFDDDPPFFWSWNPPIVRSNGTIFWVDVTADYFVYNAPWMTFPEEFSPPFPEWSHETGWTGTALLQLLEDFRYEHEVEGGEPYGDPEDWFKYWGFHVHLTATGPAAWETPQSVPDGGSTSLMLASMLGLLWIGRRWTRTAGKSPFQ